ncbi:TetR/AcrR family transcriptional regulator [Natrinema hispanicum]|uniref:DNA-binding transcriptional regulator, AcrR family n=1 Tax=Natrinema hispanicum TaxID=392421 RepID=A0A1G6Q6H7_9EURY|nr:TetR/AcrR family transcriptional regulator [Natrinema hispanicum]SDC87524.1 DNA-binding transcriptional regulator, AcrR family [Natrinema hispanicum]SET29906.1 DNA-binding transcriptional regulator, AcrR family [Natrinema hispanicum]
MSDETIDDLMEATYCALCKHGYAEVTMQDIAAESTKSKGTLHYHFDSKQDLLESFLEFLLDRFEERTETVPGETPAERLHEFTDELLTPSDDSAEEFRTAILEIKAQSPYNEAYRERLREFDRALRERIATLVADGLKAGEFHDDVEPEATADFLVTLFHGAQTRATAVDRPPERTRQYVHMYIDETLRPEKAGSRDSVSTRVEHGGDGE